MMISGIVASTCPSPPEVSQPIMATMPVERSFSAACACPSAEAFVCVRAERRLEKVMFDDIGLPDDSDCLLEAFEGSRHRPFGRCLRDEIDAQATTGLPISCVIATN